MSSGSSSFQQCTKIMFCASPLAACHKHCISRSHMVHEYQCKACCQSVLHNHGTTGMTWYKSSKPCKPCKTKIMGLPHLASIVIQEKYPVQMLEPLVQRLHCVPRFPTRLYQTASCFGCVTSADQQLTRIKALTILHGSKQQSSSAALHISMPSNMSCRNCCLSKLYQQAVVAHTCEI